MPGGMWTEDEEGADMGDGIVEVRTFDTAYIEVAGISASVVHEVLRRLSQS